MEDSNFFKNKEQAWTTSLGGSLPSFLLSECEGPQKFKMNQAARNLFFSGPLPRKEPFTLSELFDDFLKNSILTHFGIERTDSYQHEKVDRIDRFLKFFTTIQIIIHQKGR